MKTVLEEKDNYKITRDNTGWVFEKGVGDQIRNHESYG